MVIHVVQPEDTIQSIAELYGISVYSLVQDNDITDPNNLSIGQSIIIEKPELTYRIKEGDTLHDIAVNFNVSVIQLLANNPYLVEREYIYPGEDIVIQYQRKGSITTHGNTFPYIEKNTLRKTLPYLTYLSVINYTMAKDGTITSYYDDTDIISITKDYGVVPLMLLTTLTIQGEANIKLDFDLILNEGFQKKQIDNTIIILKTKGYLGVNISLQNVSESNMYLYNRYIENIAKRLYEEGMLVFVTINPNLSGKIVNDFEKVDYSSINQLSENIIFMNYEWATSANPPSPISSMDKMEAFLEYILKYIPSDKVIIGVATIGYDWEIPYVPGISNLNYISYERFIDLANSYRVNIKFDESSKTPYLNYKTSRNIEHIVWFIDSRSINASLELVSTYQLSGISVWNITNFNSQLWFLVNSQYEIQKVI